MRHWWLIIVALAAFIGMGRSDEPQPLTVTAKSALLADAETGEILWQRNPDLPCYPASLTKIMTAVLILEHGNLDDWVTITKDAAFTGESSMALKEGERVRLRDLLNAILVRSANDACVAAAIHLIGSVERFVEWMNEKAKGLGMSKTHFVNPHGLHDPQHYTTARDLLTLTRYALRDPTFRQIVAKRDIAIAPTNESALRHYYNRNKLLSLYPGCDGVKTGWTVPAGKCIVASATRNGWQLIAVVLNSQDHFSDAAALLDYGFHNFVQLTLAQRGEPLALFYVPGGNPEWLRAVAQETVRVVLPKAKLGRVRSHVRQTVAKPPVQKGQTVGEIVWEIPGASRHCIKLVALKALDWSWEAKVHMVGERFLLAFFFVAMLFIGRRWLNRRRRWR